MKRFGMVTALLLLPIGLFVSGYQSYRYYQLSEEVRQMENRQRELIETNKRTITRLSQQQSPQNILRRAQDKLGMEWPVQSQLWTLEIQGAEGGHGTQ
jgi:hypothetical protein